jgi:hypothetical protein
MIHAFVEVERSSNDAAVRNWLIMTYTRGLFILVLLLGLVSSALAGEVRCTTTQNTILNRLETLCDDGTRATSYWNTILERWERTVQPAPGARQTCTARMNAVTKTVEVQCR